MAQKRTMQEVPKVARSNLAWSRTDVARALAKEVEIGHPVPLTWYRAAAEVVSIVYKFKKTG
jgi:flagellar biosynthesis protein FlhB